MVDGEVFPFSGRVEVYRNGEWSTICDKNWIDTTAAVVCRQLGYGNGGFLKTDRNVPPGSGPVLMDNVKCGRAETNLFACSHSGFGNHDYCGHVEDVGVSCWPQYYCKFLFLYYYYYGYPNSSTEEF